MAPPNPFSRQSPDFSNLAIFGSGGSGREVAWLARQAWGDTVGLQFVVDDAQFLSGPVNDVPVVLMEQLVPVPDTRFLVALGSPAARERIVQKFALSGFVATTLVHPRVETSQAVTLGVGTILCANSVVTCNVTIGAHVQVNLACTISHDVIVGDYSTLSPGVHVSGHVHIGRGVFIGTGANIINGTADAPLIIGDGAVVAAGACVTKDVPPHAMVAGVPAVRKR